MNEVQARAYALASADALGIPMDEQRAARVASYLALTARFAAMLDAVPMGPEIEPAEVFCPAPFPATDDALAERGS
ncbi:MAG: DUF4089 domain-containing protein [Betaproteobacteria bacterium]|jgi:hypothetical protein|nr:DUF4089 domain-containing protein [Betaproteobacteria bacterium]NBS47437.1 DUF4089 domain-containing protein [Betaproteobacteria bacterium]